MPTPEGAPKPRRKPPSAGRGRRKGELNKVTRDVRHPVVPTPEGAPKPRRKPPSAGRGRRKGELNKVTRDVRQIIAKVAEKNADKIDAWLSRIGRKNPAKAMDLYLRMLEYHIPKLTRTEIVKPPGSNGRVIDSSQLTAEQREQLRQMILGMAPDQALLEAQKPNVLEPVGLGDAQVIDNAEVDG